MIITAVERSKRGGQVRIYVDGVAAFEITRSNAAKHRLQPGTPIDDARVAELVEAEHRAAALRIAAGMLARRPRSERDVRQRLARRGIPAALVDEAIARLLELRLLDDAEFARAWTESRDRSSPRGRRVIVRELRDAGVAAPIASEAASIVDEDEAAYRAAIRRARTLPSDDYRAFRERLGAYLQRRGFGWEVASATVTRCWRELTGDDAG